MATPRTVDAAEVRRAIADIAAACHAGQIASAIALLGEMVPEFDHVIGTPNAEPVRSPA
jgi:hypothetical protein